MKALSRLMVVAAGLILLLPGCGHSNSGGLSAAESQAFDKGPPEVKQMWTLALEASKTNDYVTAYNMLYNLGSQSLSPDQKQAVTKQTASLNDRMLDGVGKGDPAAQNALEELKRNPPNRQPH